MIRNNQALSSQKLNIIINKKNSLKNFISKPNQLRHCQMNMKIKQSQDNLFNFVKDSII